MKRKAQSLVEFAIILMAVTAIAMISLQIISNKINSSVYNNYEESQTTIEDAISAEEQNCTKMGLHWDKQNGICEAK
ncbi:MAG: hypothetical protein K6A44_04345 [bacterium]|nr:hypothetical protein [bacterium]